jgi:hypothetical protein
MLPQEFRSFVLLMHIELLVKQWILRQVLTFDGIPNGVLATPRDLGVIEANVSPSAIRTKLKPETP